MSASTPARATAATSAQADWTPGPAEPVLADAAVHVWRVDLLRVGDGVVELLSAAERTRATTIAGERQRLLWSRSRGALRQLLGRYLRQNAGTVELSVSAHGKPRLAAAGELHFNLSHSRHLALYAFATAGPVGVDVQLARDRPAARATDYVALARRSFGEQAARTLAALDEQESREREFLRLWTRYEAELKRRGTGIGAADRPADDDLQAGSRHAAPASTVELDVAPDAAAALALGWRASELRRWDWA